MNIAIDSKYISKIKNLEEILNIKLYLVGGAVRDLLLGQTPKDLDFVTSVLPDDVEQAILKINKKTYILGKKFGTIGFKYDFGDGSELIEITTFRSETYTDDNRKPEVVFTDNVQVDLGRRDFTINAMAINSDGKLIDIFEGQKDLENKIVRAVGNPKIRFTEDPLRLLRAIRFSQKLGFEIEQKTLEKIIESKFKLLNISRERWVLELDQILSHDQVRTGLNSLMNTGLLGIMIPELKIQKDYDQNSVYHDFSLWEHTLNVVELVPKDQLDLRWAGLLHDIAKPFTKVEKPDGHSGYYGHELLGSEMAKKVCNYLKFSNQRTDFVVETIKHHLEPESPLKQYDDGGKKIS